MDPLQQDLRYGWRALGKSSRFTLVAVATLALGIGATTAIFTAANTVLLRPLPYPDPARLAWVSQVDRLLGAEMVGGADYLDWK